ncbi:uncharacterized protein LOC126672578 [Mercurialis annua]|uniref:uncharacterized protein LOC126672578 n=1 Tax=Mercurialis annua TaxID=3986 RepID=UPI00215FFE38|nr:uncharacterized protein LOC126672578 [Mercurialis annua]
MKARIKDTRKYYKFHEDYRHETDGCRDLKVEIERMIDAGELRKFIAHKTKSSDKGKKRSRDDKGKEKEEERPLKILGTIHMINGGGHNSSTIRKKQKREVMTIRETHMPPVIFDSEDYEHVKAPHNDALVVTTIIENWNMERILIDEGSAVNLMTNAAYKMLGGKAARLRRVSIPLSGLGGPSINPLGAVTLEVIIEPERGINKKIMSLFNIVDMELTYNTILGRPFLHDSAAITSIRAIAMKKKSKRRRKRRRKRREKNRTSIHPSSGTNFCHIRQCQSPIDKYRHLSYPMVPTIF